MENASKALLIAGGVLLAMIVISMCMMIIENARTSFRSAEEKRQAQIVQEETVKFAPYVGNDIYGSEVENCRRRALSYERLNGVHIEVVINGGLDLTLATNKTRIYRGIMTTRPDGTIGRITFNLVP